MIEVTVKDKEVIAKLQAIEDKPKNLRPIFAELGEILTESVKERFATSRGPDGKAWAKNRPITIQRLLKNTKGNFKKRGGLTKKGERRVSGKKPLIGETKSLSGTIHYKATASSLRVGSSRIYSRVQQMGAAKGSFGRNPWSGGPLPWGNIPARPYLGFSAKNRYTIADVVKKHLDLE